MTSNGSTKFQEQLLTANEGALDRLSAIGETPGHNINNPLQALIRKGHLAKLEVDSMHKHWQKVSLYEGLNAFEKERRINQKHVKKL